MGLRLRGKGHLRVGACHFYGPPEFLTLCCHALDDLKDLDSKVLCGLTKAHPYVFWFHESAIIDDRFSRIHSIPKGYLDWGQQGVVVRYVYAVFIHEMIGNRILSSADMMYLEHDAVRTRTREWLKARNFPPGLLEPFNASARD